MKVPEKENAALGHRPEFDMPFFRGNFFEMNPITLLRRFTEQMDPLLNAPGAVTRIRSPPIEVQGEDGRFRVTAETDKTSAEYTNEIPVQTRGTRIRIQIARRHPVAGPVRAVRPPGLRGNTS